MFHFLFIIYNILLLPLIKELIVCWFTRIEFWEKPKIRLSRFFLWFLRTTNHLMNHHSQALWMCSSLQQGLQHLHWNLQLNFILFYVIYCLQKHRQICVIISRFRNLISFMMYLCFYMPCLHLLNISIYTGCCKKEIKKALG